MSKNYPTPAEQDQNLKDGDHIALVKRRCPVTGTDHDAEIVLHTRFGDVKEMHGKVVGWLDKPCDEAIKKFNLGPEANVALCGLRKYMDGEAVTAVVAMPQTCFADMCNGNQQHIALAKKHLFIMTDADMVEKYIEQQEESQKKAAALLAECEATKKRNEDAAILEDAKAAEPKADDFIVDETPDEELGTTDPEA